jgi:hypothetical protein
MFNNPGIGLRDVPFSVPELDDLRTRAVLSTVREQLADIH